MAPSARKGPKGTREPVLSRVSKMPAKAAAQPTIDAEATVKSTAFQPRKAPMAASSFTSPNPMASRGIITPRSVPVIASSFFKGVSLIGHDHSIVAKSKNRFIACDVDAGSIRGRAHRIPGRRCLPNRKRSSPICEVTASPLGRTAKGSSFSKRCRLLPNASLPSSTISPEQTKAESSCAQRKDKAL